MNNKYKFKSNFNSFDDEEILPEKQIINYVLNNNLDEAIKLLKKVNITTKYTTNHFEPLLFDVLKILSNNHFSAYKFPSIQTQ